MTPAHAPADWIRYAIPFTVVAVVMAFRLRSIGRERPLKVERLWVVPALYVVIAGVAFWAHPPVGLVWLWCLVALAAGAALGWQRGRMMRIAVDPETHAVSQRTSPAALLLILGLIVVRSAARNAAQWGGPALDVMTVTDVLIAFALGLLSAQRLEIWLRARRLLAVARAG